MTRHALLLAALVAVAPVGAEPLFLSVDPEAPVPRFAESTRPFAAGPERPHIALDLDGNDRLDDLGSRGSGKDGVLVMGTVALDDTSLWDILRGYDTDQDGTVDPDDPAYDQLKVWIDLDGDAVLEAEELTSLAEAGVEEITLPADTLTPSTEILVLGGEPRLAGIEVY